MCETGMKMNERFFVLCQCERGGATCTFATSYMVGREDKRTNNRTMLSNLKNNAVAVIRERVQ